MKTNMFQSVKYRYLFSIFDQVVMATFVCEILLKWYYGFWIFWKAGWNILDFLIIAALLLGPRKLLLSARWSRSSMIILFCHTVVIQWEYLFCYK